MRISDWSSDVCSSDLPDPLDHRLPQAQLRPEFIGDQRDVDPGVGGDIAQTGRIEPLVGKARQRREPDAALRVAMIGGPPPAPGRWMRHPPHSLAAKNNNARRT